MKKSYRFYNNIIGWVVFAIAAFTFLSTIEPTASFWDCGEFLATSYKLEVGHPPGAPLFMLMARFVSLFASSPQQVPILVNSMSALASAFTILFLFWTITHLAKKIILRRKEELTTGNLVAIFASGIVGALAYTFSDSFWFSAVEAEVYASSSLFTALVFWAILKWEDVADEPYSNRWIILIAYLIGLSIGVHLLSLLVVVPIVFIYYFRKNQPTRKGIIITSLLALFILGFTMWGIIPGIVIVSSWFELMFVNGFGLPYNSGVIFYLALLVGLIIWGLRYTFKKQKPLWHTVILIFTMILIGYSTFIVIVIRSNANPPLDENNPEDVFSLLAYLDREQYGDRPLFYGQCYNAPIIKYEKGDPYYEREDGKYKIAGYKDVPVYDDRFTSFFPRMWSPQPQHVREYKRWANIEGIPIQVSNGKGGTKTIYKPTFGENLAYFFKYQIGFMYLRYFMWNFSGRQNDIQGHGSIIRGNWLSGIPFIDNARLGPQDNLPHSLKDNKARNVYFMLPLLLGLIGLYFHSKNHAPDFWVVMLLFIMTGLAIVVYLNQYPLQPRERDYAYVGSFYAFAMWIGLGVMAIYKWLAKKKDSVVIAGAIGVVTLFAVPINMGAQNWDDHDRSNRYTARDFAENYLQSCAPNSIIFTNGDNDTFPLWYAQEVEGVRTDVRVVNLSLFNTDWYIDQMKRKAYESDPIPNSFTHDQYAQGTRDYLPYVAMFKDRKYLKDVLDFIKTDDPRAKVQANTGERISFLPTKKLALPVNLKNCLANGTVNIKDTAYVPKVIPLDIKKNYILKGDLMVMDMISTNDWKRPIYFAITVGRDNYMNLEDYFQLEGMTYRITPIRSKGVQGQLGRVNSKIMYDNLMHKFKWGGINDTTVYLDENNRRMTMNFRNNFSRLAAQLMAEGDTAKAKKVLDKCMEVMPNKTVPFDMFMYPIIDLYFKLHEPDRAMYIMNVFKDRITDDLNYYARLDMDQKRFLKDPIQRDVSILQGLYQMAQQNKQEKFTKDLEPILTNYYQDFGKL